MWEAFLPPIVPKSTAWIPEHIAMPDGSEYDHFSFDMAPHTRGPLEAWDDPMIRTIILCWGTRMCKTSTMISLLIFAGVFTPRPMVWGGPDEESVTSDFNEKHYPMLEKCEATRSQLLPKSRRGTKSILLRRCRIRKAYSGGKATVAGFPACYVFATEIDKWTGNQSTEADAFESISQRNKGYPLESKFVAESTPSTLERSRIWKLVTAPTTDQRLFQVPCPHCGEFQILERGTKDTPYGLKWKSPPTGKSDVALAEATAYYECRHCHKAIHDHHRHDMMRRGQWVSKGQSIDKQGKVTGTREVTSSTVAFGPCSSLYSLWFGWGIAAKHIVEAGHIPKKIRDNQNSFWALPFDPKPPAVEPHQVAMRLIDRSTVLRLVPEWAVFLTRGIDVQDKGKTFVWVVMAWGPGGRGHVVDFGVTVGVEQFQIMCAAQIYQHADGGQPLRPTLSMIDSSDSTEAVYELCRNWKGLGIILPTKGSSTSDFNETFRPSRLEEDGRPEKTRTKIRRGELVLIIVNVKRTNHWMQGHIDGSHEGTIVARLTLPPDCDLPSDFILQLTNEYEDDKGNWKKLGVNDDRDAVRMAYVGKMYITNHGKHDNALPARPAVSQRATAGKTREKKPNPYTEGTGRWDQT